MSINAATSTPHIGYGLVSEFISSDADLNIFRRFLALNARNILYLQSELIELEARLEQLDEEANDRTKGNDVWAQPRSWRAIKKKGGEYWETVERMSTCSEKYYKALQSQSWLLNLKRPAKRPETNLYNFLQANRSELSQSDASFILEDKFRRDCATLSWNEKELLSVFLEKYLYRIFEDKDRHIIGNDWRVTFFSEERISSLVRVLAVVLSSALPILSIVALYFIPTQTARLGAIVAFSALCSATLAASSNAKNVEIIAATAAYAAVQVVFVSGTPTTVQSSH